MEEQKEKRWQYSLLKKRVNEKCVLYMRLYTGK
jgi:hypothetical protein